MFVKEYMTPDPVTITADVSVPQALRLMRDKKVRRLPVLDGKGKLIGIVSDKDLLHASPSPATSLAVWEMNDLLARLKVEKVMTREVISVSEEMPIEEAARIMVDRKIGGLPVMREQSLVGIITETDLFKVLLEMLGGRRPGVRVAVSVPGKRGTLAGITNAVFDAGGSVVGLGISEMAGSSAGQWDVMLKVQDAPQDTLVEALKPVVAEIQEVRET
jgi:acetoin utilization protein AcuB